MSKTDKKPQEVEEEDFDRLKELSETEDFRTYLRIAVATGKMKEEDFAKMDEHDKDIMIEDFEAWVKAGKPTPKMPEQVQKEIDVIHSMCKIKKGRDVFITYNVKGEDRTRNIEYKKLFGKRTGSDEIDETLITGEELIYEKPFEEKYAKELLKKAKLRNPDVKLSIKREGQAFSYAIHNEENFFKDFDSVFEKGSDRKMI